MKQPKPVKKNKLENIFPGFYRIKNWEKYQHKDHKKTMPWIKLYVSILDDAKFCSLSDQAQHLFFKLLLLYSRSSATLVLSYGNLRYISRSRKLALITNELVENQLLEPCSRSCKTAETPSRGEESLNKNGDDGSTTKQDLLRFEETLIELWNSRMHNKVRSFFVKRRDLILSAFQTSNSLEYWKEVVDKCAKSKFLSQNQGKAKPWKTTLDWILEHHVEIVEGKFDDDPSSLTNGIKSTLR